MAWEPQVGTQSSAILATFVDELFFGGARGGGKSDFLLGDYLQDVNFGSLWRGIIFRKTYPELEELQMRAMEIFPSYGAVYKATKSEQYPFANTWYFPSGATLKMRYLENNKDADNYQGHQYAWIGFDELTNHATNYGYNKLKACLRVQGVPKRIRASGNPGGKGHLWVKERFIDPMPAWTPLEDEHGLTRMFIPSRISDNKYLRDDAQYLAMIKSSGSAELVKAWLDGNWDVIAGAYFDCWDKTKHVIKPFLIPTGWTKFRSFDWGSAKPFSVGWWAISDGTFGYPKNALIRYREWYGKKDNEANVGLKLTAEAVAIGIKRRETTEKISYGVADPSCWKVDGGESFAERMSKHGVMFRSADNSRVSGWDQVRQRLVGMDDAPMIYFFDTCLDTIRTLPLMQHKETDLEDIDSDMEDHAADEIRYACMSRPFIRDEAKRKKSADVGTIDWLYERTKVKKEKSIYRT